MTAPTPESTSAVYRRCAAAVERAIAAIQANPSLYRNRAARNKLVELAAAAKQLDRQLDGHGSDDDHFGEAFAAAALDMRPADVDALAACAAAADCRDVADASEGGAAEATPGPGKARRAAPSKAEKNRRNRLKKREKKRAARQARADAELPPCREIDTPPEVLEALKASERAATPEPTLPADPSLFKPYEPTVPAGPSPSKPGGTSSWGRGFLAIGTVAKTAPPDPATEDKAPDLRDPYAYIASTIDDEDLTAPALHDAPSPPVADLDGLVIEEVTPEELARLGV